MPDWLSCLTEVKRGVGAMYGLEVEYPCDPGATCDGMEYCPKVPDLCHLKFAVGITVLQLQTGVTVEITDWQSAANPRIPHAG